MSNTLYYAPGACSLAAHIVLEEIGEPYETKRLSLKDGDQKKPEFLAINPHGKVPTLKTDTEVVTENVAILSYLADTHPEAKLFPIPTVGLARTHAIEWLAFISTTVHPAFGPLFGAARMVEREAAQKQLTDFARQNVERWFADIDRRLAGKSFALGDDYSVIDAYLYVFWRWASGMKFDLSKYPAYGASAERVKERPATQRALKGEGFS